LTQQPCKCNVHKGQDTVRFRSIPYSIPSPEEWYKIKAAADVSEWEPNKRKSSYASSYDFIFKLQLKEQFEQRQNPSNNAVPQDPSQSSENNDKRPNRTTKDYDRFIHLFASPIFRMVSANWARLVVRRSFDLDLLEWRARNCLDSQTIEEIKSRRVAITRHQRDIQASLDNLYVLASGEGGKKIDETMSIPGFNLGRPNGFFTTNDEKDSWWSIFWDFYELKQSMDTLEKRATKIHDSSIGMIGVVSGEHSNATSKQGRKLNSVVTVFSVIALPFSVVPPIFGIVKDNGNLLPVKNFVLAVFMAAIAVFVLFIILFNFMGLYAADELEQLRGIKWLGIVFNMLPEHWRGNPADILKRQANEEEKKLDEEDGRAAVFFSRRRRRQQREDALANGNIDHTCAV